MDKVDNLKFLNILKKLNCMNIYKQLCLYFSLSYIISWSIWFPLYGDKLGFGGLPIIPFNHALGGLGPLIASLLISWRFNKKEGTHNIFKKSFQLKPFIYLFIALLSPFIIAILAAIIDTLVNSTKFDVSGIFVSSEFKEVNIIIIFIYNLIFFGFGEEVGWRGFALPRLQVKKNAFVSTLILTIFWALWHLPLFFYRPGYTSMDIWGIIGWVLSLLTGSILLTWLFNSSRGSIFICAVFHSTIDIAFTADLANISILNYMGFLITIWGILTFLIFKPQNLSIKQRTIIHE